MIHGELEFLEITPEMRERLHRFYEEHADDPLGDVATRIVFEDDRVRIWETTLEPGRASDKHYHAHDYYLAIWQGDLIAGVTPDRESGEDLVWRLPEGGITVSFPKGLTEWAYNVGEQTFRQVLIELKDS
jgi:hypothetical protein